MRSLIIFISLLGFIPALGQTDDRDILELKRQLKLPADEVIRVSRDTRFPKVDSIRTYVAVLQSESDKDDLISWINKWNRKNGPKYGGIEPVDGIDDATVIIVQFRNRRIRYEPEQVLTIGNIDKEDRPLGRVRVETDIRNRRLKLPLSSYLLVRENGFWTIVYADVETSLTGEQRTNPYSRLRSNLRKKLKER